MTDEATDLLSVLLAELPRLLDDVGESLRELDPGYAAFLEAAREEVMVPARTAIIQLVGKATELLEEAPASGPVVVDDADVARALFEELGREQWRTSQPLATLLAAFHLGGRVAWRHISQCIRGSEVSSELLAALAEALFALVDDLCHASMGGYVAEQAASASQRERARDLLVERLLSDRADSAAVVAASRAAGWTLPRTAAVILVRASDEPGWQALGRLLPDRLLFQRGSCAGAIVPDPDGPGRRDRFMRQLRGTTALIGPTVPVSRLPESARLAEAAAEIFDPAAHSDGPYYVVDHLDEVIVQRDQALLRHLREKQLRPLAGAKPASRQALHDTLRSWLVQMGNRRAVADELGIHLQTVRYRLERLHELFGPALEDPATRLRLLLAVGWEDALGARLSPTPSSRNEGAALSDPVATPLESAIACVGPETRSQRYDRPDLSASGPVSRSRGGPR